LLNLEDVVLKRSICWFFRKKRLRKSHAKNLQSKVGEAYATTLG